LGGVHIKPGPLTQIIGLIICHSFAAWACIGKYQRDALLRRPTLCAGLGHGVFVGAGQPRQIPQYRHRAIAGLIGQEQAKGHVTCADLGGMGVNPLHTAETCVL